MDEEGLIPLWLKVTGLIIVSMLAFSLVFWGVRPMIMERQREQNKQSQQYQDALITDARNLIKGINNSNGPDQMQWQVDQFCAKVTEIKDPVPADIAKAKTKYC